MYPDPNEELKDPEYSVIHDKYLLTRKLGSGTYASVYLTQELTTGRRYACKVVNKRKAGLSERQTSNKLVQEIEVIRHFNHPNIIRVHNCIETRLYLYVVMDLAQSGELFDYLAAQYGIEETKCKLIMYQIFKGLKYLHENKVVHRDIKPENILLDFSGEFPRVMLADFGLAKRRNTEGPERMTTLCGTLNYLAPEVINPPVRAQGYDDVVDCWAAGIMLFFLLTCRHPFDDENDTKLKKKILRDELKLYAPASDGGNLFDHLSPEVADLIHQLLARNPAERLSAAAALKHPWFMSSITELKTAYKAVHQSWEAQAHRAPPSALTTAEPISAGELFSQSQAVASQLSQGHPEDEQESDLATVGVSAQQPWVPDEDAMMPWMRIPRELAKRRVFGHAIGVRELVSRAVCQLAAAAAVRAAPRHQRVFQSTRCGNVSAAATGRPWIRVWTFDVGPIRSARKCDSSARPWLVSASSWWIFFHGSPKFHVATWPRRSPTRPRKPKLADTVLVKVCRQHEQLYVATVAATLSPTAPTRPRLAALAVLFRIMVSKPRVQFRTPRRVLGSWAVLRHVLPIVRRRFGARAGHQYAAGSTRQSPTAAEAPTVLVRVFRQPAVLMCGERRGVANKVIYTVGFACERQTRGEAACPIVQIPTSPLLLEILASRTLFACDAPLYPRPRFASAIVSFCSDLLFIVVIGSFVRSSLFIRHNDRAPSTAAHSLFIRPCTLLCFRLDIYMPFLQCTFVFHHR
ncbi:kinase-like domain-containing protein [Catenaria anguillulae PL171]|uniref:Kinase-like domain-containing protein n=1 Tax=Catenaria anguillulae PL171 TaxID=765915 RepID=A0A1Y2I3T4_9FUNG|nr:kinase-like domain-containing protein [Catenaria anguillulae PL171]